MKRILFFSAILSILLHLAIINHYSINWDFHHVFFAGLYHHRQPVTPEMEKNLPFTEPDPRRMVKTPFGPLQSYIPVSSYLWFYETWKLLPFDSAYNLPTVVVGVIGIFILYAFLAQAIGRTPAIVGFVFLALYPRWWGDLHTNVKDVPTAVAFTTSIWLYWRLLNRRKILDLWLASTAFAVTFNLKVNAVAIPPIAFLWTLVVLTTKLKTTLQEPLHRMRIKTLLPVIAYFMLAPLLAFLLWAHFWDDPAGHLVYLVNFFKDNTQNIEVLYFGKWFCSAVNVPWHYPYAYLAIVTPLPILLFFLIGLMRLMSQMRKNQVGLLFLLWFFVPLARYLSPKIGVIDGIRHFEEVIFPMIAIAAIGFIYMLDVVRKIPHISKKIQSGIVIIVSSFIMYHLSFIIVSYHPYQLSYFNELVGGLPGAIGKFDIDYWGISQKEAVMWLNAHAPLNSKIYIVMAPDVAGKYLRDDLRLTLNTTGYDEADYVVVLNRQSFFYRYLYSWEYFLRRKPVFTVTRFGTPMTWVYGNSLGKFPRQKPWWTGEDPCIIKYW